MPTGLLIVAGACGALVWAVAYGRRRSQLALVLLCITVGVLGAAWHGLRQAPPTDCITRYATDEGVSVRLRGMLLTSVVLETRPDDPLRSRPGLKRTSATLQATEIWRRDGWAPAAGRVRLSAGGELEGVLPGDHVECGGELRSLQPPANPGEFDARQHYRDQRVFAFLHVKTVEAIRPFAQDWSVQRMLAQLRRAGSEVLRRTIEPEQAEVAEALLLGNELPAAEETRYVRTGVIHVLVISGQHLVILCGGYLWIATRLLGCRRRRTAGVIALFAIAYALLTGAGAPIVRAAAVFCALCAGTLLRRAANPLNSLALAWLVILVLNPADIFQPGCQLSFLAVLVLFQLVRPLHAWYTQPSDDPLQRLIEESRPHWQKLLLVIGRWLTWSLVASLLIWIASAPLVAGFVHLFSPVAVLLSPFLVLLTSVALLVGFPLLLLGPFIGVLAAPLAGVVEVSLKGCAALVALGERLPAGYAYTAGPSEAWLAGFYALVIALMLFPAVRRRWPAVCLAALAWVVIGFYSFADRQVGPGLRCTFLSVGHGGCAVLETPDGRVLLYDAGSLAGPEVTQRYIAPFLWSRGITRIDEVLVSHADLDHFNGLPALLDRFAVAQISVTPSFFERHEPAVRLVAERLRKTEIPTRVLSAGVLLQAGPVELEVLHPPRQGPPGNENARSLVLLIRYAGRKVLLTGDLEGAGLQRVLSRPSPVPDVLLAPHHGSATSNTDAFAHWATQWAKPSLIVSSENFPRWRRADPYTELGGTVWRTGIDGAAVVHIDGEGIRAETHRSGRQWHR